MGILVNKIRTPDGTILDSRHVHDYKTYEDDNGEVYMVDGGMEYLRRSVNLEPFEELSVSDDDDFTEIRQVFTWGTYGKAGDQPLEYVHLFSMSTAHIIAILDTQTHISKKIRKVFEDELEYRAEQGIVVDDVN